MGAINRHKNTALTEAKMQDILNIQYMTNPQYVLFGLYVFNWESDFLFKTKSGFWHEVEIKLNISDFKKDFEKTEKHKVLSGEESASLRPNYYSFCIPVGMVDKVSPMIPPYAGLYTISGECRLECIRKPPMIHSVKIGDNELNLINKFYFNYKSKEKQVRSVMDKTINELRNQVNFLKAEFKAVTGFDIKEVF